MQSSTSRFLLKILFVGIFSFFVHTSITAQLIPIGSPYEATARSMQLMGKFDSSLSFTVRPGTGFLFRDRYGKTGDTESYLKPIHFAKNKGIFYALPLSLIQQYNSHHPYGWNDGAMIAARGYQALASGGIYTAFGPMEIQLQPELVYAANSSYEHSAAYGSDTKPNYAKLFPGQSTISLSSGRLSIGVSTANMWWGPGIRSSLLMSNNAPGFTHLFFQTRKPVKTAIGNFEWQLIGGWLTNDSSLSFENDHLRKKDPSSIKNTRYLNGLVLSYQPKWVPGLFVGFTRAVQTNAGKNQGAPAAFFEKYLPVIVLAVQKKDVRDEDSLYRDQVASFFLRWVFPKANMELYIEYGYNDYGFNVRDYLLGPTHSAAYLAGIRKIIPKEKNKWVEFGIEITKMSQSPDWMVRSAGNWYEHGQLKAGYTNQNQILGAGAGFGADVLSLDAKWVDGWKQLGFVLERVDRDPVNYATKWIDLGLGLMPQLKHKQFLVSGLFELIKSQNYLWETGNTVINVHTRLSVQYHF